MGDVGHRRDAVFFLSDYGLADEFVGVVKAVLLAAGVPQVVDITHEIPPHDVRAGALALARAAPYVLPAVVLAVVDPGVATSRREVGARSTDGSLFVGPDNGLLGPALALAGGAERAVRLRRPPPGAGGAGPTFAGRDVFAPAAARLFQGSELASLGESLDPASLVALEAPTCRREGGELVSEVQWVDRFGNAQLSAGPAEASFLGERVEVGVGGRRLAARRVSAFADLRDGGLGLITDSVGRLAIVVYGGRADRVAGLSVGDQVVLASQERPGAWRATGG